MTFQHNDTAPASILRPAAAILLVNTLVYNGSRLVTGGLVHHDLTTAADRLVPLLPWTVAIYLGAFLFWAVNYIIALRQDRLTVRRFVCAEISAKLVCLLLFVAVPTTNVRPEITGSSLFDSLMRFLYQIDPADNLLPSIHCLVSWFCFIAVRKNPAVPGWYKAASLVCALSICLSTLTTRQHVIADVFSGIAIAELCWQASRRLVRK